MNLLSDRADHDPPNRAASVAAEPTIEVDDEFAADRLLAGQDEQEIAGEEPSRGAADPNGATPRSHSHRLAGLAARNVHEAVLRS